MRVVYAGTPAVAVPALDALIDAGFDVVAVLTRPDAPTGRKRVLTPSPVASRAREHGIEVIAANRVDDGVEQRLREVRPDVCAVVAYGALVPESALTVPEHGWVNLHFSLLPAWRGAAPVQHAVIHGDDITGASTFQLRTGLDTGPVYGQLTERVLDTDTSGSLLERLSHGGASLLVQTLMAIDAGTAVAVEQAGDITAAPKLSIDDGRIDWTQPAVAVDRRVRGVTPEPGAWTLLAGQRVKIGELWQHPQRTGLPPGRFDCSDAATVLVGTGSHAVALQRVQPSGKKMMAASDWARGLDRDAELVFT